MACQPDSSGPKSFGPVAPYYDELMKAVPYRMWSSYYLLLLAHQDVHPKSLLDVCCGTGSMSELLLREGFEVAGFDLSEGMIREAKRKAKSRKMPIDYWVADATNFELGRRFDAAFSFFDSLNNILEPELLQNAFHSVARHLPAGASWIFDLNTAYAFREQMFDQESSRANSKLRYKWVGEWNESTKKIVVRMKFWFRDQEFMEIHEQRAYDHDDVVAMLEKAGFGSIRAFHSYTLNPPRHKSDRIHYTAIRL